MNVNVCINTSHTPVSRDCEKNVEGVLFAVYAGPIHLSRGHAVQFTRTDFIVAVQTLREHLSKCVCMCWGGGAFEECFCTLLQCGSIFPLIRFLVGVLR